ncbi:MAG: gamma-glutamyltransferase family protein [Gammaproteobacteria bacterium]|nr:gamma-glutamyltransferase family protein [Gammaproteobacteria bacterium]
MTLRIPALLSLLLLTACTNAPPATSAGKPPADDNDWHHGAMVSAANPDAVAAAIAVLKDGGHAVDAAIAAHAVLGLVEPESSGIGGSAFMLVYDRASNTTTVYDGRETAPAAASPDMFTVNGQPLGGREKWSTGVSVGVPGAVALYHAAHAAHGRSEWSAVLQPAIELASNGFEVTGKFLVYNQALEPAMATGAFPNAADYLFPDGVAHSAGDVIANPDYAATLQRIADEGPSAFYEGEIAAAIVDRAQAAPVGSPMTLDDVANFEVAERDAVCGAFRDMKICSVPPPSSGIAHIMIPTLYDTLLTGEEATVEEKIAVFVDAQRLAYADRDHFVGDPDFVDVPVQFLIDPGYIEQRATERFAPSDVPVHGDPFFVVSEAEAAWNWAADATIEAAGTSHLSIIDSEGNAVAMTASVGYPWGSIRMTHGFFLNNQMTDFSGAADDGTPVANAIAGGKRPRSSMSPTIIFDADGEPMMLTGSAGGSSILAYTTKTILAVTDWELSAQQATDFPNIVARGENVGVEVSAEGGQAIADDLIERGYNVQPGRGENSGLHIIVVGPSGLSGSADSRRHGTVESIPPSAASGSQ